MNTDLAAAVVAHVAFEPLLVLVGLLVLDESVSLVEHSVAVAALPSSLDERVLLTEVDTCRQYRTPGNAAARQRSAQMVALCVTQVTLACDDGVTVWTVEFSHVLCVFLQDVHLHGSTLSKSGVTDVALIGFLS